MVDEAWSVFIEVAQFFVRRRGEKVYIRWATAGDAIEIHREDGRRQNPVGRIEFDRADGHVAYCYGQVRYSGEEAVAWVIAQFSAALEASFRKRPRAKVIGRIFHRLAL